MIGSYWLTVIGQGIETIGILIIIIAQIQFIKKANRTYGGVDRYFIHMAGSWLGPSIEDIKKYTSDQVKTSLNKNQKAKMFYENWSETFVGLFFALLGQIMQFLGSF